MAGNNFGTTHGMARHTTGPHPAYRAWRFMKTACTNPNSKDYRIYGGRGITFPKRWEKFTNFWADMGEGMSGSRERN